MWFFWQLYLCNTHRDRLRLSQSNGVWRCSYAWGEKQRTTFIKSHYFNSYTSHWNQQERIQLIKPQLKCPLLPSEARLPTPDIRLGQFRGVLLKAVCSALLWPDLQYLSALSCSGFARSERRLFLWRVGISAHVAAHNLTYCTLLDVFL